jgi:hypothetical protein
MRLSCLVAVGPLALALAGCHEAPPPSMPDAPAKPAAAAAAPASAPGRLLRAEVDRVLVQQGPAWVLRRVLSEEVMGRDGKFKGWRLVGLPEEWRSIDIRPGDVVTRVNGMPLETPNQAFDAWRSVAKHPAIKVSLIRDGARREVSIPIDGPPSADTQKLFDRSGPEPRAAAPSPRRSSVSIGGGSMGGQDDEAY